MSKKDFEKLLHKAIFSPTKKKKGGQNSCNDRSIEQTHQHISKDVDKKRSGVPHPKTT